MLAAVLAVVATLIAFRLVLALTRRFSNPEGTARMFLDAAAPALGTFLALLALNTVLQAAGELPLHSEVEHLLTLLLIISMTWVAVRCTTAIGDLIVRMNPAHEDRWKYARKLETQTRFLVRSLIVLIVIVGLGVALMTFGTVRQLGASLLASAGIGGIILGFAARPVLGNLLAGMQIALSGRASGLVHHQPLRKLVEAFRGTDGDSVPVAGLRHAGGSAAGGIRTAAETVIPMGR